MQLTSSSLENQSLHELRFIKHKHKQEYNKSCILLHPDIWADIQNQEKKQQEFSFAV